MAGSRKVFGGGSNVSVLLKNEGISCSNDAFEALLLSNSSPSFHGATSMVNFEDIRGGGTAKGMSFYQSHDQEENGDEDLEDCYRQPGKKRRLSVDQVQFLEKNFEVENKLEPERKAQLAKDLGLQPRQVAIWFQNRRARWKTKQLEKDYEILKNSYDSLKNDYENLLKEKDKLKAEVLSLTEKEHLSGNSETSDPLGLSQPVSLADPVSDKKKKLSMPTIKCKQEDHSSANSDVFDSESPHYTDGVHSSLFDSESPHYTDGVHSSLVEAAESSHAIEHDQSSDLSQDEEDNFGKSLGHSLYNFPKLEDPVYHDPSPDCGNFEFPVEDQTCWFWSY